MIKFQRITLSFLILLVVSFTHTAPILSQQNTPSHDGVIKRNVDYLTSTDHPDNKDKLDIHMPKGASDVPVMVFFHGGGLRGGDKDRGDVVASRLVPEGIGVVSANYRLSPGVMFPRHIQDASAAFAWVVKNIARYGGDPDHIYVSGHSAGAYLATLISLDPSHLKVHGLGPDKIQGTIALSPFLYVEEFAADEPEKTKIIWGMDPQTWLSASVTPHIGPDKIPMLFVYADGDDYWHKERMEKFGKEMRTLGNDVHVREVPNRDHSGLRRDMARDDDQVTGLILNFIKSIK